MSIELEFVWPHPSPRLKDEVLSFWARERAISDPREAERRASELLVTARSLGGDIIGVSTATIQHIEHLGFPCFFYRTLTSTDHRQVGLGEGLAAKILKRAHQGLEARFVAGHDPLVLGIYLEVQNLRLARGTNETVWTRRGMNAVYIGRSRRGYPIRVWYFSGAMIPE